MDDVSRNVYRLLAERRFERQLAIGDLSERDIGVTKPGSKFHERAMAETELPNASRDHVHQDLLISNYYGRSFNEFGFHIE